MRSSRRVENYEIFFEDTLEDLLHAEGTFDKLVSQREYWKDDPDIQQIKKVLAVSLDIIRGYINAGAKLKRERARKKEK